MVRVCVFVYIGKFISFEEFPTFQKAVDRLPTHRTGNQMGIERVDRWTKAKTEILWSCATRNDTTGKDRLGSGQSERYWWKSYKIRVVFFYCCCFSLVFSLLLYSPLLLAYAIDGFKLGRLYIIKYLRNTRSKGLWKGYGRAIMRTLGTVIINCDVEKETECMRERGIESVGLIKLVRKSKAQVPHGWAHVIARGFFDL